jgi:hypothetical protein
LSFNQCKILKMKKKTLTFIFLLNISMWFLKNHK